MNTRSISAPSRLAELHERLEAAGLRVVGTDFDAARDQYAVVATPA